MRNRVKRNAASGAERNIQENPKSRFFYCCFSEGKTYWSCSICINSMWLFIIPCSSSKDLWAKHLLRQLTAARMASCIFRPYTGPYCLGLPSYNSLPKGNTTYPPTPLPEAQSRPQYAAIREQATVRWATTNGCRWFIHTIQATRCKRRQASTQGH